MTASSVRSGASGPGGAARDVAQLVVATLTYDPARGWDASRARIEQVLQLGIGGVRVFDCSSLVSARTDSTVPPLAAIASLKDLDAVRRAARLTAREARTMGVNWDLAPVCDVALEPSNPIVQTRAFGAEPHGVGDNASEWIDACQSEGVLACAKHFPGNGRTSVDSHLELPVVRATTRELHEADLVPFRAAIDAGVGAIMTAHVSYPALDPSGTPATMSREVIQWLLRQQMKFDGLVVADALDMAAVREGRDEAQAAVDAIRAGCDIVITPEDPAAAVRALGEAASMGMLDGERIHQSVRRRLKWAQWVSPPNDWRRPSLTDVAWGAQLCDRVVHQVRGAARPLVGRVEVVVVDDDAPPETPPVGRDWLVHSLKASGRDVRVVDAPGAEARGPLVVAVFGDVREGKGRVGLTEATVAAVARAGEQARAAARDAIVVLFAHPREATALAGAEHVVAAWSGDRCMQEAVARWLVKAR